MVTNLKQKPRDVKRYRRTRYRRACQPIMKLFNCTAMQVAELVQRTFRENEALKVALAAEKEHVKELKKEVSRLEEHVC